MHEGLLADAAAATEVLVVKGPAFDPRRRKSNEVLARVHDPVAIDALKRALAVRATSSDVFLMTPGDPSLVFVNGRELLGVITFVAGDRIRAVGWSGDLELVDPVALQRWLSDVAHL